MGEVLLIICPQEVHFFNASELVRAMRGLSPTTENEELALSSFPRKEEEEVIINQLLVAYSGDDPTKVQSQRI